MSKGHSGYFYGTIGADRDLAERVRRLMIRRIGKKKIDLREHPVGNTLSPLQIKKIERRIHERTATAEEYRAYMSSKRFGDRRRNGVRKFWMQERIRLMRGQRPTRDWNPDQRKDILEGRRPRFNGKTIQGHHTFSAAKYPQLANMGEIIYPVTFYEHLYEWHGGNFKNSLPGRPIKPLREQDFAR